MSIKIQLDTSKLLDKIKVTEVSPDKDISIDIDSYKRPLSVGDRIILFGGRIADSITTTTNTTPPGDGLGGYVIDVSAKPAYSRLTLVLIVHGANITLTVKEQLTGDTLTTVQLPATESYKRVEVPLNYQSYVNIQFFVAANDTNGGTIYKDSTFFIIAEIV